MNTCKNCNAEIKDGLEFCDYACSYGWKLRQYNEFVKEFKTTI